MRDNHGTAKCERTTGTCRLITFDNRRNCRHNHMLSLMHAPRHKQSLEDRRQFWQLFYAKKSFEHVITACQFIIDEHLDNEHPLYYPLVTAMHVCYSKPFKVSHGAGQLSEKIVPPEHAQVHRTLIHMRDKMFAHTDTNAIALDDTEAAHEVRFVVADGSFQMKSSDVTPLPLVCEQAVDLCRALIKKAEYYQIKFAKKYMKCFPRMEGEYRLNVDPKVDAFVVKLPSEA